jgi:hypothetical protein
MNGPEGILSTFGEGSYKPMLVERVVRLSEAGMKIGKVLDFQDRAVVKWAETKPMDVAPTTRRNWVMSRVRLAEQFPESFPLLGMHRWGE